VTLPLAMASLALSLWTVIVAPGTSMVSDVVVPSAAMLNSSCLSCASISARGTVAPGGRMVWVLVAVLDKVVVVGVDVEAVEVVVVALGSRGSRRCTPSSASGSGSVESSAVLAKLVVVVVVHVRLPPKVEDVTGSTASAARAKRCMSPSASEEVSPP